MNHEIKGDDISSSIETFIRKINIWINSNFLKLNKDKIELFVFSSKQHLKKTENLRIKVGFNSINSSMSVRNVWLILDNTKGIEKQVNYICRSVIII